MKHLKTVVASAMALATFAGAAWAEFPERPIQMIVPWGAGGGTDAVGRLLGAEIQKELGVPVNVVNRTGGSGVVGHSAIANAEPDGYTIGIMTIEIDMMHWQGLTDLTYEDYDILAIVNSDPGGVMVSADAGYDSIEALLEDIKSKPAGTFKASGTGQGGIWHVGLAGWLLSEDLAPDYVTFVPSQGAAPGLTDMVVGGVDIVPSALAEGRSMIDAKRVVPLVSMSADRQNAFPDVPTLSETTGSDWTVAVWRSVAAPDGLPDDVKAKLMDAVETAYNSEEYQTFMKDRGFGLRWARGDDATQIVADDDAAFGEVMKAAGLAAE